MNSQKAETTAVVLAAGEGKRMQPLGANIPKVILPVLGKPALHYVITNLIDAAVEKIILIVSPTSETPLKKYFGSSFKGAKIDYVVQKEQLGPTQAISLALPKIETPYFLVQYGDSLTGTNIGKKVIETLGVNPHSDGILAVRLVNNPSRYGIVKYQNGNIVGIIEKPAHLSSKHAVIGTYILKTDSFKKAIEGVKFEYGKELFPAQYILARGGKMASFLYEGKRVDLGKPEDLFNASQLLAKKPIKCIAFDADNTLYNSHKAAPIADNAAMGLLAKKVKTTTGNLYDEWLTIVGKIKNSKDPKVRTRLYSYGELCKRYKIKPEFARKMFSEFTDTFLKNLKSTKNIEKVLTSLAQDKYVVTDDIKQLADKKLNHLGLNEFFKEVITSDKVGTTKPSEKFYEPFLKRYHPEEILVVGDDWEKDLRIPAELGMQILFVENSRSDDILRSLATEQQKIHIMGIAGAGASAVAGIAREYGYQVTGCDLQKVSAYTQKLKTKIIEGHNPSHIAGIDMLVVSPAVLKLNKNNGELQQAKKFKIPILTWQQFQGEFLQKDKSTIAVAGAYGKSTTTAMIAKILTDLGLDPTCEIGAKVLDWGTNFRVGKGDYYVCEGDEYNDNFLNYHPGIAVILNIAWDHPDFFKTKKDVISSYKKFINNIKPNGILVTTDEVIRKLFFELKREVTAKNTIDFMVSSRPARTIKIIKVKDFGNYHLSIIGDFRKENANGALTVAEVLGLSMDKAKLSLANFTGVGRRLEANGEISGVKFYDDYAVQPYTILKTADALKEKFKDKKVLLVLELHTFSRIETFFEDFTSSLKKSKVDQIYITDVYAAREKGNRCQLSRKLANAVGTRAKYTGSIGKTARYIKSHIGSWDVICSMGAGDSYKLYDLVK